MSMESAGNQCGRCKYQFENNSIYCSECGFKVDNRSPRTINPRVKVESILKKTRLMAYSIPLKEGFIHKQQNQDQRSEPMLPIRKSSSENIRIDARKRVAERKPPPPPPPPMKYDDNILEKAEKVLYTGKKNLIYSKKTRSKQEKVIEFLEKNNLKKLKSQLPPKTRNLVDLSKIANRSSIADVKSQFPDYEKFMNPLSYTEWHLKTVHGVQREAERIYPLSPGEDEVEDEEYFARTRWSTPQSRSQSRGNRERGGSECVTIKSMCPILVAPGTPLTGPQSIPNHLTVPNADVTVGFPLLSHRREASSDLSRGNSREGKQRNHSPNSAMHQKKGEEITINNSQTCNIYWRGESKAEMIHSEATKKRTSDMDPTPAEFHSTSKNEKTSQENNDGDFEDEDAEWGRLHAGLLHRTQTDIVDDEYTSDDRMFIMKQKIKEDSQKLRQQLFNFFTPSSLYAQIDYLEKLKHDILRYDFEERVTRKEKKKEKIDTDIKMSKATIAVADIQCQVSSEHAILIKIEERLTQLRQVDDEFCQRTSESIEEEKELRQHQAFRSDQVIDLEAKLATSLAVEARVHRECEAKMHQLKTQEKAAYLGKLQAIRDHEDAVAAMNHKVRHLAAHRIQAAFRVMIRRGNIVVVFNDEEREIIQAAKSIQSKIRMWCTKRQVKEVAKNRFEKHYDKESKFFFYTDTLTGESQWTKPKMFGEDDIDLADIYTDKHLRTHKNAKDQVVEDVAHGENRHEAEYDDSGDLQEQYQRYAKNLKRKKKKKKKKRVQQPLTPEDAVVLIQKCYRGHVARNQVKQIVYGRFEKLLDQDSGSYYYWDTIAEVSQWHKPKVLGPNDDIEVEI